MPLLLAQSLVEYSGVSANSTLTESMGTMLSNFMDGLRGVDQTTWMILGGVILVLAYLTRRSGRQ
ncbi:MAG TPA: hypothetical protein VM032_16225 [Vicinamibacterales bacterium]|nr:hypothetical protein [Vicinamibacterales bacterium]